jgi:hypothetical protein
MTARPCSSIAMISPSRIAALARRSATARATVGHGAVASFQVAREQRFACAIFDGEWAVAVPFHFVRPPIALWCLGGARSEHRAKFGDTIHAVWDSAVLRRAGLTTIADAHAVKAEITATEVTQWATFTIADWATESEGLPRQHAYTKPDGTQVHDNDFLNDAYFAPAIDAVKLQAKRAGVRLAMLIEAAAAGTLPAHLLKLTP